MKQYIQQNIHLLDAYETPNTQVLERIKASIEKEKNKPSKLTLVQIIQYVAAACIISFIVVTAFNMVNNTSSIKVNVVDTATIPTKKIDTSISKDTQQHTKADTPVALLNTFMLGVVENSITYGSYWLHCSCNSMSQPTIICSNYFFAAKVYFSKQQFGGTLSTKKEISV